MVAPSRGTLCALTLTLALVAATCTNDTDSTRIPEGSGAVVTSQVASSPLPTEMCRADEPLALAAYDLATGAFTWAACSSDEFRRDVLEATDEAVYLRIFGQGLKEQELLAYDPADGTELPVGGSGESQPTVPDTLYTVVDGIRIEGGQSSATKGIDNGTGEVLWTQPGSPAYNDLWAVGDGAVFVGKSGGIVAYELTSGDKRWEKQADPADQFWPWHVDDRVLFAMWTNLAVISTEDGSTIWRTQYPNETGFPRMSGVRANSDTVFVAFSWISSGGD